MRRVYRRVEALVRAAGVGSRFHGTRLATTRGLFELQGLSCQRAVGVPWSAEANVWVCEHARVCSVYMDASCLLMGISARRVCLCMPPLCGSRAHGIYASTARGCSQVQVLPAPGKVSDGSPRRVSDHVNTHVRAVCISARCVCLCVPPRFAHPWDPPVDSERPLFVAGALKSICGMSHGSAELRACVCGRFREGSGFAGMLLPTVGISCCLLLLFVPPGGFALSWDLPVDYERRFLIAGALMSC